MVLETMAFWDDPQMVINHIRHSCVTSDDTGMCEMVIVKDEPEIIQIKKGRRFGGYNDDVSDFMDYPQSFDIAVSPSLIGRTPRSSKGSDRSRKKSTEQTCRHIQWQSKPNKLTGDDISTLFSKKLLPGKNGLTSPKEGRSLLTQLLTDCSTQFSNPYAEFSKFDGEAVQGTCPTKSLEVFLTFLGEDERQIPVSVVALGNACVQDVVGLALHKYSLQGNIDNVQGNVDAYSMYIAEDDGEVDMDFPALDGKESITKFGFNYLAVVEKNPSKKEKSPTKEKGEIVITVFVPQNGFSRFKVDKLDIKMKQILNKMVKKRGLKRGRDYVLEKQNDPGTPVDLEASLESMQTFEFCLLREGGKRSEEKTPDIKTADTLSVQAEVMSFQYKSYKVMMLHRLLAATEIQLGVHGKKIDIDPIMQSKPTKFWMKMKPISLDMDSIADCEILDSKAGRTAFRIHYQKGDYMKHHDFETIHSEAVEIVRKITNIVNTRASPIRTEYLKSKERRESERLGKKH